jgi:hypothetical protein
MELKPVLLEGSWLTTSRRIKSPFQMTKKSSEAQRSRLTGLEKSVTATQGLKGIQTPLFVGLSTADGKSKTAKGSLSTSGAIISESQSSVKPSRR